MHTVISTTGDQTSNHRMQKPKLYHWATTYKWCQINQSWEDVALEVAVSSVQKKVLSRHIRSCGCTFLPWMVDLALLICGMDWWPSGRVLVSAFCGCWFDLQWWRSRYALLMRPNKVETAVQCSVCRMLVFAEFSSHGNLINITSIPLFIDIIYNIYKEDLVLDNLQWLICHKTQPNQILYT